MVWLKKAAVCLACLLAFCLPFSASAQEQGYDFREDTLPASPDYAGAAAQEDMLLDMMNSVTNEPGIATNNLNIMDLPYENAFRVISFNTSEDIYETDLLAHEKHDWLIPVVDGDRCAFGAIAVIDGEYYPSAGGWEPIEGSPFEFAVRPETLTSILEAGQLTDADHMIACFSPAMYACFVYVEKGEQQYIVPFAAEFSLPGVNDKQLNTLEQVKQAFAQQITDHQQMIEDMKAQGATGPFAGGAGAGEDPAQPVAEGGQNTALIVGLSCAAALLALAAVALPVGYRLRRRKRERLGQTKNG